MYKPQLGEKDHFIRSEASFSFVTKKSVTNKAESIGRGFEWIYFKGKIQEGWIVKRPISPYLRLVWYSIV